MISGNHKELIKNKGKQARYDGHVWEITDVVMESDGVGHYSNDWWSYKLERFYSTRKNTFEHGVVVVHPFHVEVLE